MAKKPAAKGRQGLAYPVFTGESVLRELEAFIRKASVPGQFFILCDENTQRYCLPLLERYVNPVPEGHLLVIPPGEGAKDMNTVVKLWRALLDTGAERSALLLNLGGGVVSDLGGFAAGTYKRGIRYINVPTTLTAMIDAAIGGKTGVNLNKIKNAAGLFHDPEAVFIHPHFLATLPGRHVRAGFGELIKSAFLSGPPFWDELAHSPSGSGTGLPSLINQAVEYKCGIVAGDPREKGLRKVLNFGHTIGHALESVSLASGKDPLLHGEAVAAGMVMEAWLSAELAGLPVMARDRLTTMIMADFSFPALGAEMAESLWQVIRYDKKVTGGSPEFVLMEGPGKPIFSNAVDRGAFLASIEYFNQALVRHGSLQE